MKRLLFALFAFSASGLAACMLDEPQPQPSELQLGEQASSLKADDGPSAQAYCGDNICNGNERPETCPSDCSVCGDGLCYAHESLYCPEDCCYSSPEECGG